MEKGPVRAGLHIVDNARLEVHIDGTRDVFSSSGLGKESCKTVLPGFCGAFLNAAVGLWVSSASAVITKEHTRARTLSPCSRVYSSPLAS